MCVSNTYIQKSLKSHLEVKVAQPVVQVSGKQMFDFAELVKRWVWPSTQQRGLEPPVKEIEVAVTDREHTPAYHTTHMTVITGQL